MSIITEGIPLPKCGKLSIHLRSIPCKWCPPPTRKWGMRPGAGEWGDGGAPSGCIFKMWALIETWHHRPTWKALCTHPKCSQCDLNGRRWSGLTFKPRLHELRCIRHWLASSLKGKPKHGNGGTQLWMAGQGFCPFSCEVAPCWLRCCWQELCPGSCLHFSGLYWVTPCMPSLESTPRAA